MSVDPSGELIMLAVSFLCGAGAAFIFGVAGAVIGELKPGVKISGVFDLVFWAAVTALCARTLFYFNCLELRWYVPAAMILGGILYFFTIGRVMQIILQKIINILCKIIRLFFKILLTPARFLYKILIGPFFRLIKKISEKTKRIKKAKTASSEKSIAARGRKNEKRIVVSDN